MADSYSSAQIVDMAEQILAMPKFAPLVAAYVNAADADAKYWARATLLSTIKFSPGQGGGYDAFDAVKAYFQVKEQAQEQQGGAFVHVLGRRRKVVMKGRTKHVTVTGKLIPLSVAKSMAKKK